MKASTQEALRRFTRVIRPLALRSAGKSRSNTSVIRHVGRQSGRTYDTPVVVAEHESSFFIALPYGERTEWLKNVLAKGNATIVTAGQSIEVDRPRVIALSEASGYFRTRDQSFQRRFHVESALQVHRS